MVFDIETLKNGNKKISDPAISNIPKPWDKKPWSIEWDNKWSSKNWDVKELRKPVQNIRSKETSNEKKIELSSSSSNEKNWVFYWIFLIVILIFISPITTLLFWGNENNQDMHWVIPVASYTLWLMSEDDEKYAEITIWNPWEEMIRLFTYLFWLIFISILIFTPTKNLDSPILFFIKEFSSNFDILSKNKTNPNIFKSQLVKLWIISVALIAILSTYLYILNNILIAISTNKIINVFSIAIVMFVLLVWTSLVTKRMVKENNKKWMDTTDKEKAWFINTWLMLVSLIIAIVLWWTLSSHFQNTKIGKIIENTESINQNIEEDWDIINTTPTNTEIRVEDIIN